VVIDVVVGIIFLFRLRLHTVMMMQQSNTTQPNGGHSTTSFNSKQRPTTEISNGASVKMNKIMTCKATYSAD
jgi:hypothetical protein